MIFLMEPPCPLDVQDLRLWDGSSQPEPRLARIAIEHLYGFERIVL
jgi:hypothetical protein